MITHYGESRVLCGFPALDTGVTTNRPDVTCTDCLRALTRPVDAKPGDRWGPAWWQYEPAPGATYPPPGIRA